MDGHVVWLLCLMIHTALCQPSTAPDILTKYHRVMQGSTNASYNCLYVSMMSVDSLLGCGVHCFTVFQPRAPYGFSYTSSGGCACYPFSDDVFGPQHQPVMIYIESESPGKLKIIIRSSFTPSQDRFTCFADFMILYR